MTQHWFRESNIRITFAETFEKKFFRQYENNASKTNDDRNQIWFRLISSYETNLLIRLAAFLQTVLVFTLAACKLCKVNRAQDNRFWISIDIVFNFPIKEIIMNWYVLDNFTEVHTNVARISVWYVFLMSTLGTGL